MLRSVNIFWKIQVLVTFRVLHLFFFLLPCLDKTFMTTSHALGCRGGEGTRVREQLHIVGAVGVSSPAPDLLFVI